MDGKYKPFDKSLFDKNDKIARKLCCHFLPRIISKNSKKYKGKEVHLRDNPDKYGPDLCCYVDGELAGYFEPEIKSNWQSRYFSFPDLQIPERKEKWALGHKGKPVTFCVLSGGLTGLAIVKGKDMADSPKMEIPNKYQKRGELFFKVPLQKVKFFHLEDYTFAFNKNEE